MNRPRVRLFALAVLALSLWTAGPGAPPLSAQEDAPLVSSAEIASRILILAARTDLDEALRKRASDTYAQAQSELSHEADFQTRAQKAAQRLEAAPRELEEAKAKLAALERPSLPNTAAGSLNDAEAGLSAARRAVIEARGRSEALRRELDQRSERRRTLLEPARPSPRANLDSRSRSWRELRSWRARPRRWPWIESSRRTRPAPTSSRLRASWRLESWPTPKTSSRPGRTSSSSDVVSKPLSRPSKLGSCRRRPAPRPS